MLVNVREIIEISGIFPLQMSIHQSVTTMAESVLQNAHSILEEKQTRLSASQSTLDLKLEEVYAKDKFLDDKARQLAR